MKKETIKSVTAVFLGVLLLSTTAFGQERAPAVSCESLAKLALPNTTITMAQSVAAGEFEMPSMGGPPGQSTDTKSWPAFCRVAATMRPTSDSEIKMEMWLPQSGWNGRYLGVGSGGTAGSIRYRPLSNAMLQGYAAANTDAGHDVAMETEEERGTLMFVIGHPEKLIDYAYRANHEMTLKAKAILEAYYGVRPEHSFFMGCSLGSTQAMVEAKRFPEDYDGIIAGAMMNPVALFNAAQLWPAWLVANDPSKMIPAEKYEMVQEAEMKACATPVGLAQGIIEDPERCTFDPATLLCKGADAPDCLTAPQVEVLRQVYEGPVNPRTGELIFPGPPVGGVGPNDFNGEPNWAALSMYQHVVHQDPDWDWKTMDFDTDIALARKILDPIMHADANLKPFFDHGGKLLLYTGGSDYINPNWITGYYKEMLETVGPQAADSVRIFILPSVGHCLGKGAGCTTVDLLGILTQWAETGDAPERILSSKLDADGKVIRTRPLCAYPKVARYKGTGDMADAASFVCAEPVPEDRQ